MAEPSEMVEILRVIAGALVRRALGPQTYDEIADEVIIKLNTAGYKIVAWEPSEAMTVQGSDLLLDGRIELEAAEANARCVWRAMWDAA